MHYIQVINPNTSVEISNIIRKTINNITLPETKINIVHPLKGIQSIEGYFDAAIASIAVLEAIIKGKRQGINGYIIACFGDPGLLAAREIVDSPVIGIAEAAMHTASFIATKFSIITTLPRMKNIIENLVQQYGFQDRCKKIYDINMNVLSLTEKNLTYNKLRETCIQSKNKDGIGAIILGCSGMSDLAPKLTEELGLPVIEGIRTAVKIVEFLLNLGIKTSKHGDLAYPIKKQLTSFCHDVYS